jgi:hypothetical protein
MQFLSSKMFSLQQRCYSTPKAALKLWVNHNGGPSTQVPIKDSVNIDDFAKKVKRKLNTNCQVSLFTSLEKEPIKPWLPISELLKTDALKKNSGESPLFVKLLRTQSPQRLYISEILMMMESLQMNLFLSQSRTISS